MSKTQIDIVDEISSNTKIEMDSIDRSRFSNKDPLKESKKYLARDDVIEIFKLLTVELYLNRPVDPIKSMIDKIQELKDENKRKSFKHEKAL